MKSSGVIKDLWENPWGRALLIGMTVAVVSWALRETAVITWPVIEALRAVLIPLAIGFTIAYVIAPVVDTLHGWGLRRTVATSLFYVVLGVFSIVLVSLVLPALVRQGSELVTRLVDDFYYHDRNGNGSYDEDEPVVIYGEHHQHTIFFRDDNGNGVYDAGETKLQGVVLNESSDEHGVGVRSELSLLQRALNWSDDARNVPNVASPLTDQLRREWRGQAWDAQTVAFVAYYLDNCQALEADVAQGESLAETVQQKHDDLLKAWVTVRKGSGPETQAVQDLRIALAVPISDEQREQIQKRWKTAVEESTDEAATTRIAEAKLALMQERVTKPSTIAQHVMTNIQGAVGEEVNGLPDLASRGVKAALNNISALISFGLDLILIPVYAFFLTIGMPTLRYTIRRYIPEEGKERTIRIAHDVEKVVAAFFRGRLIVCLICAILTSIGFAVLGVPYGVLFGILIGLSTAIPLTGLLFLVPAVLLVMADGGEGLALRIGLIIGFYGIIQALEATVFTPFIMGREVELHPVVLLIALLLCGNLLGVLGLLLAVPIAATIRILLREFVLPRVRSVAGVPNTGIFRALAPLGVPENMQETEAGDQNNTEEDVP